jgi:hypothetical protein
MMKKLVFDTLRYAKMLTGGGVEHSDVHAQSLADALSQNVYIKGEVDKMIEKVFNEFEERTRKIAEHAHQVERQTIEIKVEMNRIINRHTMATITILGGLMALFTFVEHLIH